MSITLEGTASVLEDGTHCSGLWRFTKEKKSFLSYKYKLNGLIVPRELYDYVSFVNEPPSAITPAPPGRKSKDSRSKGNKGKSKSAKVSRGRGRPPSILESKNTNDVNTSDDLDINAPTNEAVDPSGNDQDADEDNDLNEENNIQGDADLDHHRERHSLESDHGEPDDTAEVSPTASTPSSPDIVLKRTHPLIGLWEGTFNVKIPTGEDSVEEKFFFYAVQSSAASISGEPVDDRGEQLSELPPDPLFPYALLPAPSIAAGILLPPLPPAGPIISTSSAPCSSSAASGYVDVVGVAGSSAVEPAHSEVKVASSTDNVRSLNENSVAAVSNAGDASANTEGVIAQNVPLSLQTTAPSVLSNLLPAEQVVLLGFGRNSFGRFSMAGIYDEKTGELRCEKKYMVTKYSAKRGRRSYAECAATAVAAGGYPLDGSTAYGLLPNATTPSAPPSTRQRLAPAALSHYAEDFEESVASGGSKRKRGMSTASGMGTVFSSGSKTWKSSKNNKEQTQAQAAAALAAAVAAAGPNALVGARNPDNDDPESSYREAFMDCDTGEVYEGEWYYGMRHGKGICIYSDGLMYEGSWVGNKEHGKGMLMTGDRQIIYSGDWLEGYMHGFGTYNFGNGDRYMGDWREGIRHGKGDYSFRDGCRYSGEWKDNRRSGRGVFVWPDGSYYSGDWEHAQRHGRGKLELANGFVYDGSWARNLIEGKGVCRFPGGQEYEGTYKNGLREGRGTVTFAEGAVYEGRFREDRFDGQGTLKVERVVPGAQSDEVMIPLQVQSDFWRIHLRAGFGNDPH